MAATSRSIASQGFLPGSPLALWSQGLLGAAESGGPSAVVNLGGPRPGARARRKRHWWETPRGRAQLAAIMAMFNQED